MAVLTVASCSKDQNPKMKEADASVLGGMQLESPNGIVFAKSTSELQEKLATENPSIKKSKEIEVASLQYYENDGVSVAIVNYNYYEKEYSSLYMLQVPENYLVLHDEHSLRFVKKTTLENEATGDVLNFEPNLQSFLIDSGGGVGSAKCIGGKCCKWKELGTNTYNCGCPSDVAIIVTTSDGCKIQL